MVKDIKYTLAIVAESGYESEEEGRISLDQYKRILAILAEVPSAVPSN